MGSPGKPYRTFTVSGFEILVGKGDAENDSLTFEVAEPQDVWFHVGGVPGSHVILRNPEGLPDLPKEVVRRAATLFGDEDCVVLPDRRLSFRSLERVGKFAIILIASTIVVFSSGCTSIPEYIRNPLHIGGAGIAGYQMLDQLLADERSHGGLFHQVLNQ